MLEFKSKSLVYIAIICALVVSVFSASGKDTIPCHVEHDYTITQAEGECKEASHERTLTFTLKPEMIGLCKGPNQYNTTTSCECSEFDFIEESTPCQNGLRAIKYKKLFNCINGYQPKDQLDQPCECTENDIGTFYDECVNGNISVIPYYKTNCRGGVELPPIKSFPCDLTCPNGFYLAPPASECQICPNGTYHFSEGIRYTKWDTWPDHFATNCSGSGCHFWRLKDDHIDSGDQSKVKTSATSLLEHRVEIVREPAYVSFSYKLESNELSEFGFYVDSKEELFDVDDSTDFQNKTILLSKGVHILKWYFYYGIEDSSRQQKSSGLVTIKNLEITGTQFLHHECEKCPPGHFSHSGQAACTPCPVNTHSDKWGQSTCHKCDDSHYALEGYSKCLKRPVCTKKDIVEKYGACREDGMRTITYSYIEPKICVDGVALPNDKEDDCARCEPGMIQKSKNLPCTPCPDGTALIDNECVACSAGSAAVKKLQFVYLEDNNGQLPKQFTTSCIGACGGQGGWQVANDEAVGPHLTSGTGHGKSVNVQLALDVNLYTQGSVKFEFQFENYHLAEADDILLSVYVDEQQIVSLGVDDMKNQEQRIALSKGEHRIVWAFQKYSTESQEYSDPAAILKNIIIVGESSGSADTCSPCRAGYKCPEGAMEYSPCQAGSFSTGSQTSCQKCPAGTFTDRIAQSTCILCGNGTYPNEDSTTCINECRFADPSNANITYDLTSLKSETFGPFSANDTDADLYFGICQVVSKKTCNDRADRSHEYGCAVERKYAESIGNMISFTPKTDQDGLDILLTRAAFCWDDNDEKQEIKTEISMLCDPNAGHGKPELQKHYLSENSNCTNTFTWTSSLACRECTASDYEGIEGVCNNGTRKVSYFWKKDIRPCSGGVELPDDQVYECPACGVNDYTSVAGECVNGHRKIAHFWKQPQNCTVNAAIFDLPKDLVVECTDYTISHSAAYFGAFVISTALIALLSGLVFLYIRHMKLYRSYSLLTNKGKNKEMNNVVVRAGDDDTDDERHDNVSESEAHTDPSDTDSDHDFLSEKRKIDEGSNVVTANKTNNVMLSGIEDSHSESEGLNNSNTNNNNQVGGVSFHEFT